MDMKTSLPKVTVSHVDVGLQSISFHVSRIGVPVLVKISYFPRWHATGATGPYRVSPNLMVVIPTSHDVSMVYGSTPMLTFGNIVTDLVSLAVPCRSSSTFDVAYGLVTERPAPTSYSETPRGDYGF